MNKNNAFIAKKVIKDKANECLKSGQYPQQGWLLGDLWAMLKWKNAPLNLLMQQWWAPREKSSVLLESGKDAEIADLEVPPEIPDPNSTRIKDTSIGLEPTRNAVVVPCVLWTSFQLMKTCFKNTTNTTT
jgi:hypothetical protein